MLIWSTSTCGIVYNGLKMALLHDLRALQAFLLLHCSNDLSDTCGPRDRQTVAAAYAGLVVVLAGTCNHKTCLLFTMVHTFTYRSTATSHEWPFGWLQRFCFRQLHSASFNVFPGQRFTPQRV